MYDVIIIGAGVSGCTSARELSRYKLNICVVDKESDVCEGTSKANSAIVHGGFDAKPGTLKAKLNVMGNELMEEMSKKLDFPFRRNGSMVVCRSENEIPKLKELMERGAQNGVKGMKLLGREEALALEPNLADEVYAALLVPSGGIVCPFTMNIAYAENAAENGVEFRLETEVTEIRRMHGDEGHGDEGYELVTNQGILKTKCVVNAAGVYADIFHNMVSDKKLHITPRRGDYCLLDKSALQTVSPTQRASRSSCPRGTDGLRLIKHTIFQLPNAMGKGVLVTPTVHGNLLIGPTAFDVEDKESTATTGEGLQRVLEKSRESVKHIPVRQVITSFAGLRAHEDGGEFIIEEVEGAKGFIDVAGIESPGLSSAPAIGIYVRDIVIGILKPEEKENFIETRKDFPHFNELSLEERKKLAAENPAYGKIVCRCEMVTEGEILNAIHRPLGARTIDGVKRRTRAGMGRCQAGFCTPRTMELLAREWNISMEEIRKNQSGSELLVGTNKDRL